MNVTVVGTGYVGLVTGVCLANSGHNVRCVDIDEEKVAKLRSGASPIYEPGIEELLVRAIDDGRLTFETPSGGWGSVVDDIVFVAVGTPMAENGAADLSAVRTVVEGLTLSAERDFVLVMKSTVPPGTAKTMRERYLSKAAVRIGYVSNPEFLREGHALEDWYETDRIVLGGEDPRDVDLVSDLYADIEATVLKYDAASAETVKYASNAFLSTKISFVNEIANVCDCVAADIDAVSEGIGLDKRIGPYFLKAGIGYGGSCFPKDTRALDFISKMNGYSFDLLKAVIEVNNRQRLLPLIHLNRVLKDLSGRRVAVLGISFKPDTDDVRESPALDIIPLLVEEGAEVCAYDPLAAEIELPGARRCDTVWDALEGAEAAVLVTEWPEFVKLDWAKAASVMSEPRLVFDGRNALDRGALEAAGLKYMAVGREGAHRTQL